MPVFGLPTQHGDIMKPQPRNTFALPIGSNVKLDTSKLKRGCTAEGDTSRSFRVGPCTSAGQTSSGEEEYRLTQSGIRCGIANLSALTLVQ